MKKLNLSFWLGAVIVILLILVVLFPSAFTKSNPFGIEGIRSWVEPGGRFHLEKPPFAPSNELVMGSDGIGRDIYSLIIYGSRLTLFLSLMIVLSRFLIALPLGLSAGFGSVVAKSIINQFAVIFSAIPALLISVLILNLDFFVQLDKGGSLLAFTVVLTAVGWGKLGLIISERVEMILKEPFIAGDWAIGKNRVQMTMSTVIPHLLPELIVLFFLEIARALSILMQLGVFSVFVGNVRIIEDSDMGTTTFMNISYEPEWASMLGTARKSIRSAPWTVWYPAMAFFISVLGLNLFGEGLRTFLQDKSNIVGQIKGLWRKKQGFRNKYFVFALIFILVIVGFQSQRHLSFTIKNEYPAYLSLQEGPVVIGTENAKITAKYISEKLEDFGFLPLKSEIYLHPYQSKTAYYPHESKVVISDSNGEHVLTGGEDYLMFSFGDYTIESELIDYRKTDLFNYKNQLEVNSVKGKTVILDGAYYTTEAMYSFSEELINGDQASAVIWSIDLGQRRQQQMGDLSYDGPAVWVDQKWLKELDFSQAKIQIQMVSKETNGQGINIIGYRPGTDQEVKEEALVYGFAYNALSADQSKKKLAFAFEMIQQLLNRKENEGRTIVIAFFDGTLHEEFLGQKSYVTEVPYSQKHQMLFVDMTRVDGIDKGEMLYSIEQSPITRYFAYSFSRQMQDRLNSEKIKTISLEPVWESDMLLFLEQGTPTLVFGLKPGNGKDAISINKLGQVILETITFNNY